MTTKDLGNPNNEKIEDLNLIALRKYACPKISSQNDWYLKCVECSGLEGCKAGKRAVELLELNTKPEKSQVEKFNERLEKSSGSAKFIEALKSEDPVGWLVEHGYYEKRWRAKDCLKKWANYHRYDGSDSLKNTKLDQYASMTEKARLRTEGILNGCNDEETLARRILADNPEIKASSAVAKLYDWKKKYPEMHKEHPEIDGLIKIIGGHPNGKSFGDLVRTLFGEEGYPLKKEPEGDEVSVEDFLKETTETDTDVKVGTVAEAKTKLQKVLQEQQEKPKVVDGRTQKFGDIPDLEPAKAPTDQEVLLRCFSEKRRAFKAAILIIEEDVDKLRKALCEAETRKTEVCYKLKTLDASAEMFGLAPIKTDEVATKTGDMMGT